MTTSLHWNLWQSTMNYGNPSLWPDLEGPAKYFRKFQEETDGLLECEGHKTMSTKH